MLAVAVALPSASLAACAPPAGGVVECTDGGLAGGVPNPPGGTTTLNVHDLDADITPAANVPGVIFVTAGAGNDGPGDNGPSVTINFTDTRTITTTGANGIIGQSTGGLGEAGGGIGEDGDNGGSGGAVTVNNHGIVHTAGAAGVVAASIGGSGGNGGNSGAVNAGDAGSGGAGGFATINNFGEVQTTGDNAAGLLVVSRGGNGAIGGDEVGAGDAGDGGGGGAASTATVDNKANVSTAGAGSAAILARSLGGNGGPGGDGHIIVVGGGGGGGATGNGGAVNVTSNGVLTTTGAFNAVGIMAQSVGGFAGNAGDVSGLVTFGGDGNSGGFGGRVEVKTEGGSISTSGTTSYGILAQSIGGGGGTGGTGAGLVGFGGDGGPGGAGGEVVVNNNAAIKTTGNGSTGVVAQSVGGGGGSGGTGAGLVAVGGGGNGGGNASNVSVGNTNTIEVQGNGAGFEFGNYGIFAQSIGGKGGSANVSGGIVTIGGSGGPGGNAGTVTVTNSSSVTSTCTNCRDAGAIYAQSVGGGGGRGGSSFGFFAIGGSGGAGGTSSAVSVTNSGSLETHGMLSRGIFAQSIGGGGGDGGFAGGAFTGGGGGGVGGSAANPLRIGGQGAASRDNQIGAGVTVTNSGKITTAGDESQGIFAQSVGGGGGNGGGAISASAFLAVAVGGTGGIGGNGGTVKVDNLTKDGLTPEISTGGERSAGIFAQSVGGGGGSGGFAIAASGGIFAGLTAAIGGDGGKGGDGMAVIVNSDGKIDTRKSFSSGIHAESIGGGGGRGGFSVAAGFTVNGVQATLSFGGKGAGGGKAGDVTVDNSSQITTGCAEGCVSDESHGIFASSIGGGGGSGGFSISAGGGTLAAASVSFGGNAGEGNSSGIVKVDNDGKITTYGRQSNGILAQSIGGGGGNGGFSGTASFSLSGAGAAALAFGGEGGAGGGGNTVTVNNHADIETFGASSNGILAQSIGGGGGNGGFAGSISFSVSGGTSRAIAMGGTAGEGSTGRAVTVTHAGNIKTHADNSTGILAQSVGGGGGTGGFSLAGGGSIEGGAKAQAIGGKGGTGGTSGIVKVGLADNYVSGTIETSGAQSHGIQAQSIAGGGGTGGFSISAGFSLSDNSSASSIGGAGGSGQNASQFIDVDGQQVEIASVEVYSNATIVTGAGCAVDGAGCKASGSHGILAQSIGGGGGSGGLTIAAAFSLEGDAETSGVGGRGGGGGDGGMVWVESGGKITTRGPNSNGIFAQSVGGGGGAGAFSLAAGVTIEGKSQTQNVGGAGGAAGRGSAVTVKSRNDIATAGASSHGILAQSIGGGGGAGGFSIAGGFSLKGDSSTGSIGGAGNSAGDGGAVVVESSGKITTQGANSHGVFAQSVGGGGGSGAFSLAGDVTLEGNSKIQNIGGSGGAAGKGGTVDVTVLNDITTGGVQSHGVLAQSVGGGGGDGGFSVGANFSLKADVAGSSVGGAGGGGGDGMKVTVNVGSSTTPLLFPTIHTTGDGSIGVFAQSVGGGGGSGGLAIGASVAIKGKAENKVGGGGGGAGGVGGEVQVSNWGTIKTEGDNAAGILAQSVGGGGGNGGFSISGALGKTASINNSVGGGAGDGGKSSKVEVDNFGVIETSGQFSHGIMAQSIGGSGGNGGFAVAAGVTLSDNQGASSSKVGGGVGGAGGDGGEVVVNNTNTITVNGANAFGIFAQSVGGGGGSGGIAAGLAVSGKVESAVGGEGGKGGNGGDVTVTSTGSINVTGNNSSAVFAQSVAGSGGWSGLAIGLGTDSSSDGITLGLGSRSLKTCFEEPGGCLPVDGTKGKVVVNINGVISGPTPTTTTDGSLAYGLLGQAIAGGGGSAGTVLEKALKFTGSDVVIDVGSNGSMAGDAQSFSGTYGNAATTKGKGSIGLIAQSIGGGGGVNALVADTLELNPTGQDNFKIRVGGYSAGANLNLGGSGGDLDFSAGAGVTTQKDNAIGIIAQTIGGGGGIGNLLIDTVGNTGKTLDVTVGGAQLAEGNAGALAKAEAKDTITTHGVLSHGFVAQSIGGGGGVSDLVFKNGVTVSDSVKVTLGSGAGGAGGNASDLTAKAAGIVTTADGAMGIVAQAIGGGGGLTGIASGSKLLGQSGFSGASVSIVGGAGAKGDGGKVTLDANGDVHTFGFGAHGIVAQSIGGGGGIAGSGLFATTLGGPGAFAGSVGGDGSGKDVTATSFRNVVVAGDDSVGFFGQSAGGDGQGNVKLKVDKSGNGVGLIWAPKGTGASVEIADGASNALDTNGTLYAQGSLFGSGAPVNLSGLAIKGGLGDETLTNLAFAFPGAPPTGNYGSDYGVVFTLSSGAIDPVSGLPILDVGTRTNNIIGNVSAGAGNNNFVNEAGGLFITDEFVKLDNDLAPMAFGAGQELTNKGLLSPGDRGKVQITGVGGNFAETASGRYFIDVDLNKQNTLDPAADRLNVTGGSKVGGEGPLLLLSINKAFDEYVIVHSEQGVTDDGFDPKLIPPVIGFDFNVKVANGGDDLVLYADKPPLGNLLRDPASGTRDPNVWRMGDGIDNIEKAITVDDPFNYLINLLRLQPDLKSLGDAVVTLTPSQAPHLFEATFRRNMKFLDQMSECPNDFGQGWFVGRRNCIWGQGSYGEYRRGSVDDSPINKDAYDNFSIGALAAVDEHWQLGFGLDRTQIDSNQERDGNVLSRLDGEIYQFGTMANYRNDGYGVGLVLAGSYGTWDANRFVNINGFKQNFTNFGGIMGGPGGVETPAFADNEIVFDGISGTARSDPEVYSFNPRLRFSYLESVGAFDAMPFLDIDGYVIHTKGRKEDGVGLANLEYPENTETTFTFTPGLELGGTVGLGEDSAIRAFVRGSVMVSTDDSWTARTQFQAAPDGVPDISIVDKFDDVVGKVDAGLVMLGGPGTQVRVNYTGLFGEQTEQHEVSGDFIYRF